MQQLCRRSLFCYYSIFEHHNLICTGNSAHPVGDDEDGFIFLSAGIFKTPFLLSVTSLINRSRDAPDHDGGIGTALAHYGHPCGHRHLHGLCNIRNSNQQKIPCDRVKSQHPPGIPCLARKQHHEMDAESQYHRNVHRRNGEEHAVLIGGARIVRMRYAVAAFEKNLSTDYANIENLEMREKQKRAEVFYNGRYAGGSNFISTLNLFFVAVVGVVASGVLIYKINIWMILLIIATCGAQFCLQRALTKKQRQNLDQRTEPAAKFDYFYKLCKDGTAAKDIQLYNMGDYFIRALAASLCRIEKIYARYTHTCVAFNGITALLSAVRQAIAYIYLAYLTGKGALSVSDFIFYFGIITGFSNWVLHLGFAVNQIEMCCKECQAYREYIAFEDHAEEGEWLTSKSVDRVVFEHVSFQYPSADAPTLKHIDLTFKNGEKIAIVGENGAGKTTLIKLLCGLYAPTGGRILLNGKDIATIAKTSYFDLFSAIFQDYYFLPMTIQQNITASLDYDREKFDLALQKAEMYDKVYALPKGADTLMDRNVYKDAVDFSGGEKQKLLLAKAMYKDAPILILDEPTAALDPIAENQLYLKYSELTDGKLSFFISHRLSSTRFCDRILFVSGGQITEMGTHEELMAKKGAYYKMFQVQSYYYREQGVAVHA